MVLSLKKRHKDNFTFTFGRTVAQHGIKNAVVQVKLVYKDSQKNVFVTKPVLLKVNNVMKATEQQEQW
jgi:hypothetical protein